MLWSKYYQIISYFVNHFYPSMHLSHCFITYYELIIIQLLIQIINQPNEEKMFLFHFSQTEHCPNLTISSTSISRFLLVLTYDAVNTFSNEESIFGKYKYVIIKISYTASLCFCGQV